MITTLTQTNALQQETSQAITAYVNPTASLKLVKKKAALLKRRLRLF